MVGGKGALGMLADGRLARLPYIFRLAHLKGAFHPPALSLSNKIE